QVINKNPIVISTWKHGMAANEVAIKALQSEETALDAVEAGVMVSESDPQVTSVGYGGLPDRNGNVTLDACIMDHLGNCGGVAFLQHIKNPVAVARLVMEKTDHVLLAGEGALRFALANGFEQEELLTETSVIRWKKWVAEKKDDQLKIDNANHDTIGMLGQDQHGNLSGACTTSGLAWKVYGRIGDSPIIGAGLYVDNEYGAASATGKGEAVIKMAGSFLVVEFMRQGKSPKLACRLACERIIEQQPGHKDFQVGFIALNKAGETGAYALHKDFQYAKATSQSNSLFDSEYLE
ncbi:MAG TPA: glycosylasparaginase, partial [Chromatiaceae bacterium]|nr:glycosylasparaginase [Chromatiaceae bacterium]